MNSLIENEITDLRLPFEKGWTVGLKEYGHSFWQYLKIVALNGCVFGLFYLAVRFPHDFSISSFVSLTFVALYIIWDYYLNRNVQIENLTMMEQYSQLMSDTKRVKTHDEMVKLIEEVMKQYMPRKKRRPLIDWLLHSRGKRKDAVKDTL